VRKYVRVLDFALFYPDLDSGAQETCHQSCFYSKLGACVYPQGGVFQLLTARRLMWCMTCDKFDGEVLSKSKKTARGIGLVKVFLFPLSLPYLFFDGHSTTILKLSCKLLRHNTLCTRHYALRFTGNLGLLPAE